VEWRSRKGLALIWSSDVELAEAVTGALSVLGYSALVPGARSVGKLCKKASLIVVDKRDARFLPAPCRDMEVVDVDAVPAHAAARVLAALGADEAIVGVDPGRVVTGYALVSNNALVHGSVLTGSIVKIADFICGLVRHGPNGTVVGIGVSPAVLNEAKSLAKAINVKCGMHVSLVDEHRSNTEAPIGLGRALSYMSDHVHAAAVIALRARMNSMRVNDVLLHWQSNMNLD